MSTGRDFNLQVSLSTQLRPIREIAAQLGIDADCLYDYGPLMAKVLPHSRAARPPGKLILVSAVNPTPAGEGKTTSSIGLTQALVARGRRVVVALREPSLGPVFGMKGGGCGGGRSQVLPMEEINLHFTGDLHAITSAHNLLSALVDNHLHFGSDVGLDSRRVVWPRVMDMNDRALRNVVVGLGGRLQGVPREERFDITAASEVMAILALTSDADDLKKRLGDVLVGYRQDRSPVFGRDLKADGPMSLLLRQALYPNLVQTVEGAPALVHAGPFANIAHGCSSVIATKTALGLADIVVTEAGFGFDLGAEKFINIKCRSAGLYPHAIVLVATTKAMKFHGGVSKNDVHAPNLAALVTGLSNLDRHVETAQALGIPVVVSVNKFSNDNDEELDAIRAHCGELGVKCAVSDIYGAGGEGGAELADHVINTLEEFPTVSPRFTYDAADSPEEKMRKIVQQVYGGDDVVIEGKARRQLKTIEAMGFGHLPICMAKTQYSLSDDAKRIGRPKGFNIHVREVRLSAGAGFIVAITGSIMTMPGLPRKPAAEAMGVGPDGEAQGVF
jgi:formate--tetrahydrofolate ligase